MTMCSPEKSCDRIFVNGVIQSMDENMTSYTAMAVLDGRVVALGSDEDIPANWIAAERIDLGGAHIFPGLIDAHAHLFGLGEEAVILPLHTADNKASILWMLQKSCEKTPNGQWIRGRGWDQNDWHEKTFPRREDLDRITRKHPVFLSRVDGHAAWVNSRALEISGITTETPDPEGGRIMRDTDGKPTGILLDNAIELVRSHIPPPSQMELKQSYREAIKRCLAVGMTGMHDMGMDAEDILAVRSLIDEGNFPFRMVAYIDGRGDTWEEHLSKGRQSFGNEQLIIAGLKLYADGALGSRGAWLLQPYSDDPGNSGIPIIEEDTIAYEAGRAIAAGLQVCVHAIGDAAVRCALNGYETATESHGPAPLPLRVEHAQIIDGDDIPRFAELGVLPSMQPTHCTSDMYWAEARLGATRVRNAYAWDKLIRTGVYIPGGSDFPVERPAPLSGIYAAAFRRDVPGRPSSEEDIRRHFQIDDTNPDDSDRWQHGWYGSQRMSREHAVRAFTDWAARAAGMETSVGTLTVGNWADFVILSQDILAVPEKQFLKTVVRETWHAGEQVFTAE